jgi:hypothetical protein
MAKVYNFPEKRKSDPELQEKDFDLDESNEWDEAVKAMEKRFGGVSLSDLEDENEEALKIADRALSKEWLQSHTEDMNRK